MAGQRVRVSGKLECYQELKRESGVTHGAPENQARWPLSQRRVRQITANQHGAAHGGQRRNEHERDGDAFHLH